MKLKEMWSKILKRNRKNYSSEICLRLYLKKGFSGGSDGKESETCLQCGRWFEPWVRKIPWSRKWQPDPVFLPGKFHGLSSLGGYSPWGCKESVQFSSVTQSCPTLCDSIDWGLPGSSVHGIFQAIVLEWIAISFSRGSSQPRVQTWVSCIVDRGFTV